MLRQCVVDEFMRIVTCYRGNEKTWDTLEPEVVFGRTDEKSAAVLDLFPDKKVSRAHGRIWDAGGQPETPSLRKVTLPSGVPVEVHRLPTCVPVFAAPL